LIVDYHMHLRAPAHDREEIDHSVEAVERYVERAAEVGVDEIGFTEHVYYFRETRDFWWVDYQRARSVHSLDTYVDAVLEAKRRGLPVKLGLEVDWPFARAGELDEVLEPYPWDYLLCSIHFIGELGVDGPPRLVDAVTPEEAWRRYFAVFVDAAESGLYDAMAHPDLVKIFGVRSSYVPAADADLLDRLARAGVCLEVSSAGLNKPAGELYPAADLLRAAHERGIPITLASDAHLPQDVGKDLDAVVAHARAAGYSTVTVFDRRKRRQKPLG